MVGKVTNNGLAILGQYRSDYLAKSHVRELAKLLGKNHATILPHLKVLEKDKVLISETVGKNKMYSLNLKNIVTREYLNSAESLKTIELVEKHFLIKKLLTDISLIMKNTPIILFGSYARGTEKKGSDIDIVVIKDGNERKVVIKIKSFAKTFNKHIHVQTLSKQDFEKNINKDHLVIEIVKDHIILNNINYFTDSLWRYYNER